MPYSGEYANSYGYKPLVTDEFVQDRLKTFSFQRPKKTEDEPSASEFLSVKDLASLPLLTPVEALDKAVAIDGSLAEVAEDRGFDLAAVKVGCVVQNLSTRRKMVRDARAVDPAAVVKLFKGGSFTTLLPGEGVYTQNPAEDVWQDKFRQELHETFKHFRLPYSTDPKNLLEALRELSPSTVKTRCMACIDAKRLSKEQASVTLNSLEAYCTTCFRDFYLSDYVFTEAWNRMGKSHDVFLAMMLILERILFHSMLIDSLKATSKLSLASTVFVLDGPLAVYSTASLNAYFLDHLQSYDGTPLAMGVEKTGIYARFALTDEVQNAIAPGSIAMVTAEAANVLAGRNPSVGSSRAYTYGKRFIYRTRDGLKTFVFMALPAKGSPSKDFEGGALADDWDNYPSLRTLCEFMEENKTEQFGSSVAALDVVAEANHEASLPKVLSGRFLDELVGRPLA